MKVYLVTQGQYDDFAIIGIYSSKEKAEAIKDRLKSLHIQSINDFMGEWEIDSDNYILDIKAGSSFYYVYLYENGGHLVNQYTNNYMFSPTMFYIPKYKETDKYTPDKKVIFVANLWALTEEEALEIATKEFEKRKEEQNK